MFAKGFATVLICCYSSLTLAAEAVIFDSRRPIALSDQEQTLRDYYVNGGSELGLKPGVLVTVIRHMSLYDSLANKSAGDLQVRIAKVKVILVQPGLSVVRLRSYLSGPQEVSVDDHFIMLGDQLDVSTAEVDHGEKSAENEGKGSADFASTAPSEAPSPKSIQVASATLPASNRPLTPGASVPPVTSPQPASASLAAPPAVPAASMPLVASSAGSPPTPPAPVVKNNSAQADVPVEPTH